jgi:dCTP deaminase
MTVLSDKTIDARVRGQGDRPKIVIEPYDPRALQPSSLDLRLDSIFLEVEQNWANMAVPIDVRCEDHLLELRRVGPSLYPYVLQSGQFVLGATVEVIGMPDDLVARVEGKSSLGRLGLLVHATAGFIDPGFYGHITLELYNLMPRPILLYPGMPIAQIAFMALDEPCRHAYGNDALGSKYQGSLERGPVASRYWQNFR